MSYARHTPGPWRWMLDGYIGGYSLSPGVLFNGCCDGTPWGDKIDQANARLIAAAPDLLEALQQAEQQLDYGQLDAAHRIILAAIAKAEGQP